MSKPLSLLLLPSIWAGGLITGFALLHRAAGSGVLPRSGSYGFLTDLHLGGSAFFTLGLGDVVPRSTVARVLVRSTARNEPRERVKGEHF